MGLLQKMRHVLLLQALGVDDTIPSLPSLSKCPICGQDQALEVTSGLKGQDVYRCTYERCLFVGDALDIYQHVHQIDDQEDAVIRMIREGVIPHYDEVLEDLEHYQLQVENRHREQDFWSDANLLFQQRDSRAMTLLHQLGLEYHGLHTLAGFGRYLGVATGGQILDAFPLTPFQQRRISLRTPYLILPLWGDPLRISGLTLFYRNRQGEVDYFDIRLRDMRETQQGLGFLHSTHLLDDILLVYPDPVDAMRLIDYYAANGAQPPVVYAPMGTLRLRRMPIKHKIVINVDHDVGYYRLALENGPCRMMTDPVTAKDQPAIDLNRCSAPHQVFDMKSVPTHQALAKHLASLEPETAKIKVGRLRLDSQDINKLVAAGDSLTRSRLLDLLKNDLAERRVRVGGKTLYETVDGWMIDYKNGPELVCDTRLVIETIFWDSERDTAIAAGTIFQRTDELPFTAPWDEIRASAYQWLQKTLLESHRSIPIVRSGWQSRLLDIATAFQRPRTQHASTVSAWDNQRLVLPQIIIESGEVKDNDEYRFTDVPGSGLGMPEALTVSERRSLAYNSPPTAIFWALFCAVSRNLLSPIHERGKTGIALVEQKSGLVSRISEAFLREVGIELVRFETQSRRHLSSVIDLERRCPFPIYIDEVWNTSKGFKHWLQANTSRNCLVKMGPEIRACTALEGGWTYILGPSAGYEDGWRSLEGLWRILPLFVAFVQRTPISRWKERSYMLVDQLMDMIQTWLEQDLRINAKEVLLKAREYCSQDQLETESAWGGRFVSFLIDALSADRIKLRNHDAKYNVARDLVLLTEEAGNMVFVSHKAVSTLFKSLGVQEFPPETIYGRLNDIGVLKAKKLKNSPGYGIDLFQWNLTSSTRASRS